jgi:succinate dehydrogenase/fumarate reductase cytochrome b subunit
MCVEAAPKFGCKKSSCGCGGHGRHAAPPDPRVILASKFGEEAEQKCNCASGACPRRYLAITGFILVTFVVLHLAVNMLGLWPDRFQAAVNHIHGLGVALPILEIGLIFIPLTIHVALGLQTLHREKLKFGVEKHHGSDLRQWLQRVTAVILLAFLAFHLATMNRWGCTWFFA